MILPPITLTTWLLAKLENADNYDFVYVANMARADFFKSSLKDEAALAQFIKDMVDDPDQEDGFIFNRFYADCNHNGIGIPWDDVLWLNKKFT